MKSNSCGLEIELRLSQEELFDLGQNKTLNSLLNFREKDDSSEKQIELSISYSKGKEEKVIVDSYPEKVYLGNAKKISVEIQTPLYEILKNEKYCGDRFGIGGRVDISVI